MFRRLAAVLAALTLMAFSVATVMAATYGLHQLEDKDSIAWNDPDTQVECESQVASGMVLWHFVAHTSTDDFTMDATFADGTIVTDMDPTMVVDHYQLHWDVTTSLTSLTDASITGSGTLGEGGFNLSHVCPNPGEQIPEAPATALLIGSAAILGIGMFGWRMRRSGTVA